MRTMQTTPKNIPPTENRILPTQTHRPRRLRTPNTKRNHKNPRQMQMRSQNCLRKPIRNQTRMETHPITLTSFRLLAYPFCVKNPTVHCCLWNTLPKTVLPPSSGLPTKTKSFSWLGCLYSLKNLFTSLRSFMVLRVNHIP
jgi:hypothetical protein